MCTIVLGGAAGVVGAVVLAVAADVRVGPRVGVRLLVVEATATVLVGFFGVELLPATATVGVGEMVRETAIGAATLRAVGRSCISRTVTNADVLATAATAATESPMIRPRRVDLPSAGMVFPFVA